MGCPGSWAWTSWLSKTRASSSRPAQLMFTARPLPPLPKSRSTSEERTDQAQTHFQRTRKREELKDQGAVRPSSGHSRATATEWR